MKGFVIAWWNRVAPPFPACAALASIIVLAPGCALTPQDEIIVAQEAAYDPSSVNPNSVNPNSVNPNSVNPNSVNPNGFSANGLDADTLSPEAMSAVQDPGASGDMARELLRYMVSCAFTPAQSFDFSWTDADDETHVESYLGLLGLAPSWETEPLDLAGQQWVSGCLASRMNAQGVSVMLSSRGTHPGLASTSAERAAYPVREAAFFGNLFTDLPKVYACYDPVSMLPSRLAQRVCAQPDLLNIDLLSLDLGILSSFECGPIKVVGPCTSLLGLLTLGPCASQNSPGRYLYNCKAPGSSAIVPSVTTFLQGPL